MSHNKQYPERPNCDKCGVLIGFPGNPEVNCFGTSSLWKTCVNLVFRMSKLSQDNTDKEIASIDRIVALNFDWVSIDFDDILGNSDGCDGRWEMKDNKLLWYGLNMKKDEEEDEFSNIKCNECNNILPPHSSTVHLDINNPIHKCPHID